MAVVIRMKRTGRKNRPCYRISVADSRFPRDGRTIETLGLYDPVAPDPEARVTLNVERAKHWLSVGALPSETAQSILERQGAYEDRPPKKKRSRAGRRKATKSKERRAERKKRLEARRAERKASAAAAG